MGSFITPHCLSCKFQFKEFSTGVGQLRMVELIKIPYSCYDCGTIVVRSVDSLSNKCSKCKKKLVMFGKFVEDFWSKDFRDCVIGWGMKQFDKGGYVILNENYHCPKCKEMSLRFETTGNWD
jgi:hypothetical protein